MSKYSLHTPVEVARQLADKTRALRLSKGWKQVTLAERSGVSLASLRRFETTGLVSLQNLLRLAFALSRLDDFTAIMSAPSASSIAELEAIDKRHDRKRGRA